MSLYTTVGTVVAGNKIKASEYNTVAAALNSILTRLDPQEVELTFGIINDQSVVDKNIVHAETTGGDVTINGFTGGIEGQTINLYKSPSANDLIINSNNALGTQKILTKTGATVTISVYGKVNLYCNGTYWFSDV